jgi:agmatine deiminase
MIWLEHGLAHDDDTNGHIDNFACFVAPAVVLLAWTDDPSNANYARCRSAWRILHNSTDSQGRTLTVHKLYLPTKSMVYTQEIIDSLQFGLQDENNNNTNVFPRKVGDRMAASYVNFYIANRAVIVPQFGDAKADARALQTLQPLFPDRRVVGVSSFEILIGGGNIHCITQQIPGTGVLL